MWHHICIYFESFSLDWISYNYASIYDWYFWVCVCVFYQKLTMRYKWKRTVMFGYVCGLGFLAPCWTSRELRVIFLEVFKHWKKSWIALLLYASSKVGMFLCNYFVHVPWYKSQGYFHIFEHICAWIASAFMIRNRKISIYRDINHDTVFIHAFFTFCL